MTYGALAHELGMPNPRNLNYVLGSVGQTLVDLNKTWSDKIPPIQCLAVNQDDDTPGQGFGWFMPNPDEWKRMSPVQRRRITEVVERTIYAYPRWPEVLDALRLAPVEEDFSDLINGAAMMRAGGESEAHKKLKEFVRRRPQLVGAKMGGRIGRVEESLPSGDKVDVFFDAAKEWVAVEVKPLSSDALDLTRGLYQCIKYCAVLRAMLAADSASDIDARAVLVIAGRLPERLRTLRMRLGVEVIEGVAAP
jgi:hypothetical protein